MTPEGTQGSIYLTYTVRMKIREKIKRLFHREPPTEGELEARAEAAASHAERAAELGECRTADASLLAGSTTSRSRACSERFLTASSIGTLAWASVLSPEGTQPFN